jgi:hypothetical protein
MIAGHKWPLRQGANCACCGGPVDAFGCTNRCEETEQVHRDLAPLSSSFVSAEERLETIKAIADRVIRANRPEFLDPEWTSVYELAGGTR